MQLKWIDTGEKTRWESGLGIERFVNDEESVGENLLLLLLHCVIDRVQR